jgi:pyrroloquinoline quinone (PQQ) biosynthesis protein C
MTLKPTRHPTWVREFLKSVAPFEDRVVNSPFFAQMADGTLSMKRFRAGLLYFYPLIEAFPKFMGLTLARVPEGGAVRNTLVRNWLIRNINVERKHTIWYRQWAVDFGVPEEAFEKPIVPPPEIDAVNHYLWHVTSQGTLMEALAAVNIGIEGPSGVWTKRVNKNIRAYARRRGVTVRKGTLSWVDAHAAYDDFHPAEALELIKMFARSKESREKVTRAAQRSKDYYAMAADAVCELF